MAIRIEDALSFPFRLPVGSLLRQIAIVSKELFTVVVMKLTA